MPATKAKRTRRDLEAEVAQRIMDQLAKGTVPWRMPWATLSAHNPVSKTRYRGINVFLLAAAAEDGGYTDPRWVTSNQALRLALGQAGHKVADLDGKALNALGREVGMTPTPGRAEATQVVLWKIIDRDKDGEPLERKRFLLRFYEVYNAGQTTGIEWPDLTPGEDVEPVEAAQALIQGMPQRPAIKWGGDRAFYHPREDRVQLPSMESFHRADGYYSTAFHELVHATGHESRLNRESVMKITGFGSEAYSKEELVAEMGAAMLCAHAGIANEYRMEQSAAYIASWLRALENDPSMVVQAAAQAQRAVDFILDDAPGGES